MVDPNVVRHVVLEAGAKLRKLAAATECAEIGRAVVDASHCGDHARALSLSARGRLVTLRANVALLECQCDLDAEAVYVAEGVDSADVDAMRAALLARTPAALRADLCRETPARAAEIALDGGRCGWPELGDRGALDLLSSGLLSRVGADVLELDSALLADFIARRGGVS